MSEVSTSRRAVMRALAILPAAIVAPPAAHAAVELVCSPAGDAAWSTLITDEQRARETFEAGMEAQDLVYGRYHDALKAAEDDWHDRFSARRFPAVPIVASETEVEREARVEAAVQDWNAEGQTFRDQRDSIKPRLREQFDIDKVDQDYSEKADRHNAAIRAIIAYPSRSPEIIAHKLKLVLQQWGDWDGILSPLLASIEGRSA